MFGGKYMEFRIIFSLQYSISINTFEIDPPSDSLHYALVKPKNTKMDWESSLFTKNNLFAILANIICICVNNFKN